MTRRGRISRRNWSKSSSDQRGSLAAETVLLVPALVLMVVFIVSVGRVQSASLVVRHAADVGARSGSQAHLNAAESRAYSQASQEMSRAQNICASSHVDVSMKRGQEQLSVVTTVECVVRMNGLSSLGISPPTVRATSSEVIDYFRGEQ
ncbi:MAG: hypothetical protein RIR69_359 [Actinomycetota bacterium]|jgi:Flp pilus assembly protein TadG